MHYNRKEFLKKSAVLSAGLAMGNSLLASPPKAKQYGMQLYTVRNDVTKNLASTLSYVSKAGYTQIELYGFDGKSFFGKTPKQFKAMFDENKLTAPSGHYYLPSVLYNGDVDLWKNTIEAAVMMGNKYMVIPWLDDQHRGAEDFKKLIDTINKLAVLTKDAGMKLAYHNHDFEFGKAEDGKTFYEHLLNGTGKNLVEFEMDLYWVVYAGHNPVDWFKKYPGRFTMWHVKDMTTNKEGKKESTQVGDGTIDFTTIYANKKLSGLKYGFMEQEAYTMPQEECIKRSIAYMKKKGWGN
ncbi:MAG: sugar phosphate isomerase/epimerase [Chitinophagaceae bacterium]|nr:sugar phosphate isomerase/epimerase [Chitinophagaceae bacterium]